jgi:ABC-type branched-subunit amino acid transport system ATPase component
MPSSILKVGGLHVAYGKVKVLHGASQIVTVIGANGTGKLTIRAPLRAHCPRHDFIHLKQ